MEGKVKGVYSMGRPKKEKTKEQRIKDEKSKLNKVFKELDANKKEIVTPLIEKAAFMHVELEELQKIIEVKGCVDEYQNGANQWGKKKSAEVDVYNTMIKNYTAIIKTLTDMVPPAPKGKSKLDELREE